MTSASQDSQAYYADRIDLLEQVFGRRGIRVEPDRMWLSETESYPIVDDVIVLLPPEKCPTGVRQRLTGHAQDRIECDSEFSRDIQFTFGEEWKAFSGIEPEYEAEFRSYFDIVPLASLRNQRCLDLGCGMGRWSYFLRPYCGDQILVDFSESIFIAQRLLRDHDRAVFLLGDICELPLSDHCADFAMCLGVLHCIPKDVLQVVRSFRRLAPRILIYTSYALDNRPAYFRVILAMVTSVRQVMSRVRSPFLRSAFVWLALFFIYLPCIGLGRILQLWGWGRYVPLYEAHHAESLRSLRQHIYDRFFSRIEQRVTREQVLSLQDTFARVTISERPAYWHFLCERPDA